MAVWLQSCSIWLNVLLQPMDETSWLSLPCVCVCMALQCVCQHKVEVLCSKLLHSCLEYGEHLDCAAGRSSMLPAEPTSTLVRFLSCPGTARLFPRWLWQVSSLSAHIVRVITLLDVLGSV